MFDPAESRPSENRETSFLDARAQYSLLITALESINDAILVTDGKGRMDLWNNKFLTLWGMPPEVIESGCELSAIEVAVKRLKDPATFLAHVNELYSSSLCAVDVFEFQEGRVIERHSQPRWLDGQVVGRVWTFRDITESRRLAEERDRLLIEEKVARAAAEFSQKRAAFLAEASTLLASSLDFHATLKAVGQLAIPSLADWCIIDLLQKDLTFRRTVVDKDPAPSRAAAELERFVPDLSADVGIAECIRSGKPRVFSAARIRGEALVAEDGREVKLNSVDHARAIQELGVRSWMTIPLNVHGNVLGALTFVSALDSRRYGARELELGNELGWRVALAVDHALLYQQARTAVRSREDLLAVVSHDLKNPLSAIYMNARLIQGLAGAGEFRVETLKKQAQIIQQSAERMNRLIRDLLDQAKIETGHFHVDRRDVDFAALVAETLEMLDYFGIGMKGPLGTPTGGGIRSLNVTMRQHFDWYSCVRPVRYFRGIVSVVKRPQDLDVVIFRENTEDVYAGVEFEAGSEGAREIIAVAKKYGHEIREDSGIGIKPISKFASRRIVRSAIEFAIEHGRKVVTIVHEGNIQ